MHSQSCYDSVHVQNQQECFVFALLKKLVICQISSLILFMLGLPLSECSAIELFPMRLDSCCIVCQEAVITTHQSLTTIFL